MPKDKHSVASHLQCSLSTPYHPTHYFTHRKHCHVSELMTAEHCYLPAHKRQRLLSLDCVLEVHHLLEEKLVNTQIYIRHCTGYIIDKSPKAFSSKTEIVLVFRKCSLASNC